jgi:hypothetical protein
MFNLKARSTIDRNGHMIGMSIYIPVLKEFSVENSMFYTQDPSYEYNLIPTSLF